MCLCACVGVCVCTELISFDYLGIIYYIHLGPPIGTRCLLFLNPLVMISEFEEI